MCRNENLVSRNYSNNDIHIHRNISAKNQNIFTWQWRSFWNWRRCGVVLLHRKALRKICNWMKMNVRFEDFLRFAPKHTSIKMPLFLGFLTFLSIFFVGYLYNERSLKKKYVKQSPSREDEKLARSVILCMASFFLASLVSDIVYIMLDYQKNKIWYVWKYKWFPKMLS